MNRQAPRWFALRFPRDLDETAVMAALSAMSGVAHRSRLVFSVAASDAGITHRLAVNKHAIDAVTDSLRAAIPSLRMDEMDAPNPIAGRRLLWQLAPHAAVIRAGDLDAIAAGLLASLYPLREGEAVELRWQAQPAVRPRLDEQPGDRREGRTHALRQKLALPGLSVYGELVVSASNPARTLLLIQRIGSVLRSLSAPHGRLVADERWSGTLLRWLGWRGSYMSVRELAAVIGWPIGGPDLPGLELGASRRLVPSTALPRAGRVLGISNLAGVARPVAITPGASTRGLYVLGPTGTGKTSLIKNLVRDDLAAGRGLAVIETNGDLVNELCDLIPPERINDVVLLDATDAVHAVGFNPFAGPGDPSLAADQLGELFQRLWARFWGPRTGQLAHMGLLTLAVRGGSTLLDLPRLFLDPVFRDTVLRGLDDPVGLEPDWRWFAGLAEREQATVVAPLLNKVRQFTARASIRGIVGQASPAVSMRSVLAERKVLLVHLPKGLVGAETAQLLGCLVLTGLWQAVAERARLPVAKRSPFGLYVDEVQDFAASPVPWEEMFAQGRKYGLSLTVAHQNLAQLPRDIREVVLANARSKAVFALSVSDAKALEGLFAPSLPAADLHALDAYSIAAIIALDDGSTARPVTLTTPPPPQPIGSAEQVRESSRQRYARPRAEVEAELRARLSARRASSVPVGRRRRGDV